MRWAAGWRGLPIREIAFYEAHVRTFTPEGTFEAIITRLREPKDLGVLAIELMPVAQFRGAMNWAGRRVEKRSGILATIVGRHLDLHFRSVCQTPEINP
jgi:hypothetical protein